MLNRILSLTLVCSLSAFGQVPSISDFTPKSGPIGTSVTITGTNFSTTAANNIVYFGAVRATVTSATSTSLNVTVPSGATYALITVTVNGLTAYSLAPFSVTSPAGGSITSSSFAAKVDFTTGSHPYGVAISDLDGDSKPDVAVENYSSRTVSVFRNTLGAPPAAPQGLTATPGNGQVTLKWTKNTEADFLRYRIYYSTSSPASTLIGSTSHLLDTVKVITGLTNGTTYYFPITAVDSAGNESRYSNEVSATPSSPTTDLVQVAGGTSILLPTIDTTAHTITIEIATVGRTPKGVSGNGVVATLQCKAIVAGTTLFQFNNSETLLRDTLNVPITPRTLVQGRVEIQ